MTQQTSKVLKVLDKASIPLSIDAVRLRAGIKSWDTARAVLLELFAEKKVYGMKTSKSWVFSAQPLRQEVE